MKIYKITEASEYLGVSINTFKTLANDEIASEVVETKEKKSEKST